MKERELEREMGIHRRVPGTVVIGARIYVEVGEEAWGELVCVPEFRWMAGGTGGFIAGVEFRRKGDT